MKSGIFPASESMVKRKIERSKATLKEAFGRGEKFRRRVVCKRLILSNLRSCRIISCFTFEKIHIRIPYVIQRAYICV